MTEGWVKLHRKFLGWEWYDCPNTKAVFLHLLLAANHEDKKWRGIVVKRGQAIIGRKKLSESLGMSERSIRSSLSKLKSTSEVTIKSTNKFSIVTIVKWEEYQVEIKEATSKTTNNQSPKRPTNDQQTTTNKNDKNDKNDKNIGVAPSRYFFEGEIIRLNERDFRKWEKAYSAIPDLRAALQAKDDYLSQQPDEKQKGWFFFVSSQLANDHQRFLAQRIQQREEEDSIYAGVDF